MKTRSLLALAIGTALLLTGCTTLSRESPASDTKSTAVTKPVDRNASGIFHDYDYNWNGDVSPYGGRRH